MDAIDTRIAAYTQNAAFSGAGFSSIAMGQSVPVVSTSMIAPVERVSAVPSALVGVGDQTGSIRPVVMLSSEGLERSRSEAGLSASDRQAVSLAPAGLAGDRAAERGVQGDSEEQGNAAGRVAVEGVAQTGFTPQEMQVIEKLASRDREVQAHEQAHASTGGQYAGGMSYEYQRGPDGRMYAVGGEVSIDTAPIKGDPEATIAKMQVIINAAMAPAEPSSTDYRVAAKARILLSEARAEMVKVQGERGSQQEDSEQAGANALNSPASSVESLAMEALMVQPAVVNSTDRVTAPAATDTNNSGQTAFQPGMSGYDTYASSADLAAAVNDAQLSMERRLVETGAFSKLFPEGSVVQNVV